MSESSIERVVPSLAQIMHLPGHSIAKLFAISLRVVRLLLCLAMAHGMGHCKAATVTGRSRYDS